MRLRSKLLAAAVVAGGALTTVGASPSAAEPTCVPDPSGVCIGPDEIGFSRRFLVTVGGAGGLRVEVWCGYGPPITPGAFGAGLGVNRQAVVATMQLLDPLHGTVCPTLLPRLF